MPAVAGLAAVVGAIVALLVCYGALYFGKMLSHLLPSHINVGAAAIPFGSLIESAVNSALAGIQWVFGQWVLPAVAFVARPVISFLGWIQSVTRFVITAAVQLQWLALTALPQVLSAAKSYALAAASAVRAYAASIYATLHHLAYDLYHKARAYAAHLYSVLHHLAYQLYDKAISYAASVYDRLHHLAYTLRDQATSYAASLVHVARVDLTRAINAVAATITSELALANRYTDTVAADVLRATEHSISAAVAGVITVVDVDSIAGLAGIWDGVIDDVTTLEGVIGLDLPDIGAAVRAIPRAVPLDLAGALTAVGAISIPMLRYMARCGVPNCRNLSQYGRELRELLDALTAGAFLGLLIGLAADPIGTAHWLHDNVGGLVEEAVNDARSVLGV